MFIPWNITFEVGIKEIDQQHRHLLDMINVLHDAVVSGDSSQQIHQTLHEMLDYASQHFATEEKYMLRFGYPEQAAHIQEHQEFSSKTAVFMANEDGREWEAVAGDVLHFLKYWLGHHIIDVDKKYGPFFHENGLY